MKKTSIFIIFFMFIMLFSMSDGLRGNKFAEKHKQEVEKQKAADLKRREAILKQLGAFQKKLPKEKGVSFDLPIDADKVTDIIDLDAGGNISHYTGVIPPKIYGYITASSLNIRSEGNSKSEIISKLNYKDKVEILFQSDKTDVIDSMEAPWLLVRKTSGEEGWVFGAYVSHDSPSKENSDTGKTDWGGMQIPTSGFISSKFGSRVDPVTKKLNAFHSGLDIAAPEGTPVYAAESGKVADSSSASSNYGNLIILQHAPDLVTYYAHLSVKNVTKGTEVQKGDLIGKVGKTGKVTGPHLHFEVRKGGQALDPQGYINIK